MKNCLHIINTDSGGEFFMAKKLITNLSRAGIKQEILFIQKNKHESLHSYNFLDEEYVKTSEIEKSTLIKNADVIFFHHIFNYSSLLISQYIKKTLKKKVIAVIHSNSDGPGSFLKKIYYSIRKFIISNYLVNFDQVVFLTKSQKLSFKRYCLFKTNFENKSVIINNFINSKEIIKKKTPLKKISLIFVGRLSKFKGFYDIKKLHKILPKVSITVVGENHAPIEDEGIQYTGQVDNAKIFSVYDKSNILILPSYTEVFPMTILEAMARGLVILVSDIPGMREIVKDGRNGYLFPPRDIKKMKEIILYLKENPKEIERISKNNLNDIWKFTAEKQVPKYIRVYEEVLKENSKK